MHIKVLVKINMPSNAKLGTIIYTSHTIDVQLKRAAMKLKAGSPPFFTLTTNQNLVSTLVLEAEVKQTGLWHLGSSDL